MLVAQSKPLLARGIVESPQIIQNLPVFLIDITFCKPPVLLMKNKQNNQLSNQLDGFAPDPFNGFSDRSAKTFSPLQLPKAFA